MAAVLRPAPFDFNDDVEVVDEGSDRCWSEWRALVEEEGWSSDDHSVCTLTPTLPSTRCVFAREKKDGRFVGAVIWNEYDDLAFIGFYILRPDMRGKGVGGVIWSRAMERIKQNDSYTIGLRAVPEMAVKYASRDTPVMERGQTAFRISLQQAERVFGVEEGEDSSVKLVSSLNTEQFEGLIELDKELTGRDRSAFLRQFWALPFTEGATVLSSSGTPVSYAGICSSNLPSSRLWKIGPVYAGSDEEAKRCVRPLLLWLRQRDNDANIVIHLLDGTKGDLFLRPLLSPLCHPHVCGVTEFSRQYPDRTDRDRLYVAHNNSGHFDA